MRHCAHFTPIGWWSLAGALTSTESRREIYRRPSKKGELTGLPRTKGVKNADYETKRRELLDRMLPRFARLDLERPSLRQLAAAAEVTAPTLQHYFGDRTGVLAAMLEEYRRRGEARLGVVSQPHGPFAESVREFAHSFVLGLQAGSRVRLGDMLAASLCEGLADREVSPLALDHIIDPAVDALVERLGRHAERGEMVGGDLRSAALMLLSPLLLAVLHQDQMCGRESRGIELGALADEVADAFIRAYEKPKAGQLVG
jgi:AcrR family transcriptional regulator